MNVEKRNQNEIRELGFQRKILKERQSGASNYLKSTFRQQNALA